VRHWLANEQVWKLLLATKTLQMNNGTRHGSKITDYAEQLWPYAAARGGWPERVLKPCKLATGRRSEGADDRFSSRLRPSHPRLHYPCRHHLWSHLRIPAPEHPLNETLLDVESKTPGPKAMDGTRARAAIPWRISQGSFLPGHYAFKSIQRQKVPIWIAKLRLMVYAPAPSGRPAHDERDFEFCRKYGIAIAGDSSAEARGVEPGMKEHLAGDPRVVARVPSWSGAAQRTRGRAKWPAHGDSRVRP